MSKLSALESSLSSRHPFFAFSQMNMFEKNLLFKLSEAELYPALTTESRDKLDTQYIRWHVGGLEVHRPSALHTLESLPSS